MRPIGCEAPAGDIPEPMPSGQRSFYLSTMRAEGHSSLVSRHAGGDIRRHASVGIHGLGRGRPPQRLRRLSERAHEGAPHALRIRVSGFARDRVDGP